MIGGNTVASIQIKSHIEKNKIGESIDGWVDACELTGFLDLMTGDSNLTNHNAKIQESTHVFVSDYTELVGITSENARMVINGCTYAVQLIDDPMGLHEHLEIFLKYVGGGQGVSGI